MLTLKLAQVNWTGAPYRWIYSPDPNTSWSGPAYWIEDTAEEVEARVAPGARFENDRLFEEMNGSPHGSVYIGIYRGPRFQDSAPGVYSRPTYDAIWKLNDTEGLPLNFEIEAIRFESEPMETIEEWIGGVSQVIALGSVDPGKALLSAVDGTDPRFACYANDGGIEIHTWMGAGKNTIRKVIMVNFMYDTPGRIMLVEKAWLLSPEGRTIEKICP